MSVKIKFAKDHYPIQEVAPEGTFVATCKNVEVFDYERAKIDDPSEREPLSVTRFAFSFEDEDGRNCNVDTFELGAPCFPSTNMLKFLVQWIGVTPTYGWNFYEAMATNELKTTVIVEHPIEKGTFVSISSKLFELLSDWAGSPLDNWRQFDRTLIGLNAQIEVVHREIGGKTVAQINSVSPVENQEIILKLLDDAYHLTGRDSVNSTSRQAWNPDIDLMAEVRPF